MRYYPFVGVKQTPERYDIALDYCPSKIGYKTIDECVDAVHRDVWSISIDCVIIFDRLAGSVVRLKDINNKT